MQSTVSTKNVFRRPAQWYKIVGLACFCFGGWVLWANIDLTILGLVAEGWPKDFIDPIAWGIAAIEAAVSIFVTQPENWDDIWKGIEDIGGDSDRLPPIVGLILSALFLSIILAMCCGAYLFDFYSTHSGLYPAVQVANEAGELVTEAAPITWKTGLFTLAYNLGTELLCFFGWQSMRLAKIAQRDQLAESAELDPDIEYRKQTYQSRLSLAREYAKDQNSRDWEALQKRRDRRDRNNNRPLAN